MKAEHFIENNYHSKAGLEADKLIEDKTGKEVSFEEIAEAYHEHKLKLLSIADVSSSFKVGTYTWYKQGDNKYCHWSEGLKMVIEKDGVVIKLEGEEIKKLVGSLPRTFGGTY